MQNKNQAKSAQNMPSHDHIPAHRHQWLAIWLLPLLIAGCELGENTTQSDLVITPASATLDASTVSITEFAADGGTSNYTWSLSDDSLGTLYTADAVALYQNTTNIGTNTLTLTDNDGSHVYAKIRQK